MSSGRDDCDERRTRLDRMINEFREAQSRRLVKANDEVVESQLEAKRKAPAMLPRSWRKRMESSAAPWSHETIDATVVNATSSSSDTRDLPRMDGSTG